MKHQGLIIRMLVQTLLSMAVIGAVLFIAAGDWRWPQAWLFLAEITLLSIGISLWLLKHDPALLETRLSPPFQRDQKPWDRLFMVAILCLFMMWMVAMGLDARFHPGGMPSSLEGVGAILIAVCMLAVWQVFRFNSFAAPQVRIQADRAQKVIDTGPYGIVRHPMYASAVLFFIGAPLLLGSWWGLALVPILIAGMSVRLLGEEAMLRQELAGYDAYTSKVRYRLLPGVW